MKTLLTVALTFFAQGAPSDPAGAAWSAASALKTKSDYAGAAAAFERYNAQFADSPRALEALVEAGVCWFSDGRSKLEAHRVTAAARASFELSLARLEKVTAEHEDSPLSSRAQYMKGSARLFMGELEAARASYAAVLDTYSLDRSYVGKALERHSAVQRHLLRPREALSEMQRWVKEFGEPKDTLAAVNKQIALVRKLEKPAPTYQPEHWIQGDPAPLETLGGQVVALYFYASWCPNCPKETPYLVDLERRYASRGFKLIGVTNTNKGQTPEAVAAHLAENGLTFPVMMDSGQTAQAYSATNIPFVALIDVEGRLRWADNPSGLCDWTVEALLDDRVKVK